MKPGSEQHMQGVAVFDFDGTSIDGQSGALFTRYLFRNGFMSPARLIRLIWWGIRYKTHLPYRQDEARELVFGALGGRSAAEVDAIMELLEQYVDEAFVHKEENQNVRTRFVGDLSALNPTLQQKLERIQKLGEDRTGLMVDVAFNYGGRNEIAHAARCIAQQVKEGKLTPEQITEQTVEQNLYTAGVPDPDLIIRPSGEQRLSNFLIWQSAYSEYVFMDVLWPDFTPEHLEQAIAAFHQRQRRFGGI